MSETKPKVRAPKVNHETKAFWDATAQGKLHVGKCDDCGEHYYYPRPLCPFCFSDKTRLALCSGNGVIYSFSVNEGKEPYTIAYVTLAEGPTILTNIVECDFSKLAIGQKVKIVFYDTGAGNAVAMFTPA
jgi:uncharacterized OB-fold protein